LAEEGVTGWIAGGGRLGIDSKWQYCVIVFDREGNAIETWDQWDSMLQRPHWVGINPYDPERHVWIIDDHKHVIHKFSNDGTTLVQTIGTYGELGADETHFNRPTFMAWFPDSSFVVSDGYNGTRAVKFDSDGNYVTSWGEEGNDGNETRPYYWNNVHGIAVDPATNRVFVNDRENRRIQVFDEDGEYLYEWSVGERGNVHMFIITEDGYLWAADRNSHKILKYDLDGNFLYSWGVFGDFPGGIAGVHGMSVDEEGNVYLAQVDNKGGVQKFVPRQGANPDYLISKPVLAGW
jgi:6-phosphogluconolactonase (cycloisomerase 2 family)